MKHSHKQHEFITAMVKKKIEPLEIVFPSQYGKLYLESASSMSVELAPEEMLDPEMLNEKVIRHVIVLASCTERAIEAMAKEDKSALSLILAETKLLRQQIDELQKLIYVDTLTKCYNRKWFEDTCLNVETMTLRSAGTMVLIDLNKFKSINDTYGHTVGDKVLVHIASKLQDVGGKAIRYGGDEFLIIFEDTIAVSKIRSDIDTMILGCSKKSFKVGEDSFKVSFSYGVAPFSAGSELNAIVDLADKAMYRHKRES
ncbi:MAG: diguanylate cyclase [Campylobacterota bacterium]|nr:diguanylate cyclase [Campylobacterota bacterium]